MVEVRPLNGVDQRGKRGRSGRRRGLCVALLGADGAGKSTLTRQLQLTYPWRLRIYKMSLRGVARSRGRVVRWLARSLRALRLAVGARLAIARGAVVVWDRHPIEDALGTPEGRRVLHRPHAWVRHIVPNPDVILVLDTPSEVLQERRPKEQSSVLVSLRRHYLGLAERLDNVVVLDATRSPTELVVEAVAELERRRLEGDRN